jgi:hypothetical protein
MMFLCFDLFDDIFQQEPISIAVAQKAREPRTLHVAY